mmetsp:Transcript_44649/g.95031  ORF Transcript_44649/g.95031 Transcript_44649/m.95031 type:complete len:295 (+) Transcript_44649:213-1097(+)
MSSPPKLDQNFSAGVPASGFFADWRIDPIFSKLEGGENGGDVPLRWPWWGREPSPSSSSAARGVSCVMCFGPKPGQTGGELVVVWSFLPVLSVLSFSLLMPSSGASLSEVPMICMGRTLLSSSKDRVFRTEEAVEQTVSGWVVTVVLDDTEKEGVTTFPPDLCFFGLAPSRSSPNSDRRFLQFFVNADGLSLQMGEMATSRCIRSVAVAALSVARISFLGSSPKRTLAMHMRGRSPACGVLGVLGVLTPSAKEAADRAETSLALSDEVSRSLPSGQSGEKRPESRISAKFAALQ